MLHTYNRLTGEVEAKDEQVKVILDQKIGSSLVSEKNEK